MAKPKVKSLQQKLGFFDEDLKSPDHDSILKWLDKNIDIVLNDIYNFKEWNINHIKELKERAISLRDLEIESLTQELGVKESTILVSKESLTNNREKLKKQMEEEDEETLYKASEGTLERIGSNEIQIIELENEIPEIQERIEWLKGFKGLDENDLPERRKPRVYKKKWEYTVTSQTFNPRTGYLSAKSVIGFIDMRVDYVYTKLCIKGLDKKGKFQDYLTWGQTERKYENSHNEALTRSLMIEVKTKIPSLGELFRQLNTYREYEKSDFLVVCPDDSEEEIIFNQGFRFYKFDPKQYI